jgi:hypothetical protein
MNDSSHLTMDSDFLGPMLATVRPSDTTPGPHPSSTSLDYLGILLTGTYSFTNGDIAASDAWMEAIGMYLAAPHNTTIDPNATLLQPTHSPCIHRW